MAIGQNRDRELLLGQDSALFDPVLPCGGSITLAIHVIGGDYVLEHVVRGLEERRRTGLVYMPSEQRMRAAIASELGENLLRSSRPRIRLVLFGTSIELSATGAVASASGFDIVPIADELRTETQADFIDVDTAIAFLHHDIEREMRGLELAVMHSISAHWAAVGPTPGDARNCSVVASAPLSSPA